MSVRIIPVWKNVNPQLQQHLVNFWTNERAVRPGQDLSTRAAQAICVGLDEKGMLWGVSTAALQVHPRIGQPMYVARQYFSPAARGQKRTIPFFSTSLRTLEQYNASLPSPESIGVLFELQNEALQAHYQRVYVAEANAVFLGYTPRGAQLRACYFDNATMILPPPAPRPAPGAAGGDRADDEGDDGRDPGASTAG